MRHTATMCRPKVHGWKNKCSFPSSHIPTPTRRPSSYIPTPTHRTEKRDKAPCSVSSPTPTLTSPASVTLLHFACFPCSSRTCCKGPRWSLRQPHRRGARGLDAVTPAAVPETPVCSPPRGLAPDRAEFSTLQGTLPTRASARSSVFWSWGLSHGNRRVVCCWFGRLLVLVTRLYCYVVEVRLFCWL